MPDGSTGALLTLGADPTTDLSALAIGPPGSVLASADGKVCEWVRPAFDPSTNGLTLTLSSGVPHPSSPVSNATAIYWTPFKSDSVALYYNDAWRLFQTGGELAMPVGTRVANWNTDIFRYWNGTAHAFEFSDWASDTARVTPLDRQDGVLVKHGDPTRLYVGTFRSNTLTSTTDTPVHRFLWPAHYRAPSTLAALTAGTQWTGTSASSGWRVAAGSSTSTVDFVCGDVSYIEAQAQLGAVTTSTSAIMATAIGIDNVSPNYTPTLPQMFGKPTGTGSFGLTASFNGRVTAGYHSVAWLETAMTAGVTFFGTNSGQCSGMTVTLQ
jgi:hypothetical protein